MATETTAFYEITRRIPRSLSSERLPFVLPDFNRHAWTSESARSVWEPRIARILRAWLDVEWLSVAAGIRDCGLIWIYPDALATLVPKWQASKLSAIQLQFDDYQGNAKTPPSLAGMICVLVGALDKIEELQRAWQKSDDHAIGSLLGYPSCCRTSFQNVWIGERCLDTTWWMAENTAPHDGNGTIRIELPDEVLPFANILWRWLGVRAVPHLPCRFDCSASIEFGERLLALARENGYEDEAEWIAEILTWPIEWSALHGVAEIKSPVMKLSTRTDATSGKWVVQWVGTNYPKEGAQGLHFPFRPPRKSKSLSTDQPLPQDTDVTWHYTDNGFASLATMEDFHRPLVALAREAVAGKSGKVLDLGCGNGLLLAKVCTGQPDLTPHGIDSNGMTLDHARQLQPQFAANFVQADIFDIDSWAMGKDHYTLAILMLGRLLEVPFETAMKLLSHLQVSCSRVLVYTYPDWGEQPLETIAGRFGLELEQSGYKSAAFLK